jgi:hypothetical protein
MRVSHEGKLSALCFKTANALAEKPCDIGIGNLGSAYPCYGRSQATTIGSHRRKCTSTPLSSRKGCEPIVETCV